MIKATLAFMFFLLPMASFAQGGGHVGKHDRQQQQVGSPDAYKGSVVRGVVAEVLYESIKAGSQETDLSAVCSAPVKMVSSYVNRKLVQCFDRGAAFKNSSRYKCYIREDIEDASLIDEIKTGIFKKTHNQCGGDGIRSTSR